jgi:DNA-binding transcriptional ArsR family regulator
MAAGKGKKNFAGKDLVRALNNPMRVEILDVLGEREASPTMLTEWLDAPNLQMVAYHTKILFNCGCLERTRTEPRRGAVEHFYRAVPESYIGHQLWRQVPRTVKGSTLVVSLKSFIDKLLDALKAGAVDDDDTSLSAVTLSLDAEGRREAVGVVRAALNQLKEADRKSRERAATKGTELLPLIGGMALFQAANPPAAEEG